MLRGLCGVLLLALLVHDAGGATITVRKDGAGDFTVIHSAVNAAADGDTILIGPGEFMETKSVLLPGWGIHVATHGDVLVRELTIVGAGEGITVIGPANYSWNGTYGPHGLSMARIDHELHISDLTIRNCYSGLYLLGSLSMQRCELRNHDIGVDARLVGMANSITDCRFSGQDAYPPMGLYTASTSSTLQVEDCDFDGAQAYLSNSNATLRRCSFSGGVVGIDVMNGSLCQLWDCDIANVSYGLLTYLGSPASHCDVHNSRIAGTITAILVDHRTSATVESSVLTGGSNSVIYAYNADALEIHGCDFVKGAGPIIRCQRPAALGAVTYDITNNYWGITDEAQIQDWIIDSNDDVSICATVQYSPYSGQSVPSESTSWGDLKALWR
jgi:hypothetical protein